MGLDLGNCGLEVASRTDRGVSARANCLALRSELSGPALLRVLNGASPEIFCRAATPIPDEFRVRRAVRRVYRYYEPLRGVDAERRARAARLFTGTIDVRSFGRGLPSAVACLREVESVSIVLSQGGYVIEVRAPSFVWGMVRKIVAALREYDSGRVSLAELSAALRGEIRLPLPLAEPERLILWEVEYPVTWKYRWSGPNRHQSRWIRATVDGLWSRARVVEAFPNPGAAREQTAAVRPRSGSRSSGEAA